MNIYEFFKFSTLWSMYQYGNTWAMHLHYIWHTLHEKCPNPEFLLVRIAFYLDWIQENTDQKNLRIWTLFTQWQLAGKEAIFNNLSKPIELKLISTIWPYPAGSYMFKVSNRNTRAKCEICSKLTIKTPERHHWCCSGVFIVNFEHISHLVLMFLLLTLSK